MPKLGLSPPLLTPADDAVPFTIGLTHQVADSATPAVCVDDGVRHDGCWIGHRQAGFSAIAFDGVACTRKLATLAGPSSSSPLDIRVGQTVSIPFVITNPDVGCPAQDVIVTDLFGPLNNGSFRTTPLVVPGLAAGESREVQVQVTSTWDTAKFPLSQPASLRWTLRTASQVNAASWNVSSTTGFTVIP